MIPEMSNLEVASHLRKWVTHAHGPFAWPTDNCGFHQHIKFVHHRNRNWHGGTNDEFKQFVLDYADIITKEEKCNKRIK